MPEKITKTTACPKCGSKAMQVVAKSDSPPLTFLKCEACGYFHSAKTPVGKIWNP